MGVARQGVAREGMATPVFVQEELEVWTQALRRGLTCGREQPWLCPFLVLAELGAPTPVGVMVDESLAGPRAVVGWSGRTRGQKQGDRCEVDGGSCSGSHPLPTLLGGFLGIHVGHSPRTNLHGREDSVGQVGRSWLGGSCFSVPQIPALPAGDHNGTAKLTRVSPSSDLESGHH